MKKITGFPPAGAATVALLSANAAGDQEIRASDMELCSLIWR
jgi:hypothetical protein